MKLLYSITLLVGLASAASVVVPESIDANRPHRKVRRPAKYSGPVPFSKPPVPKGAPSGYTIATSKPAESLKKSNLKALPSNLKDPDSPDAPIQILSRRDVLKKLRGVGERQITANDFYECRNSSPAPSDSDCNTVIDEVYAAQQSLSVAANACLVFQYGTCWGFFCSLCQQLTTTTDFIGNQLASVESLCVAGGQVGTIVGEDAPQWDAGFVYQGKSLPTYDVC
ncbi:hypothetical protein F5Y15DRAFT_344780 [Xylariaceae sp. FL0016]|nr:hypothetical protein F5Y15DRAFT_344780 [Xylariaceae sp. FL0016]